MELESRKSQNTIDVTGRKIHEKKDAENFMVLIFIPREKSKFEN